MSVWHRPWHPRAMAPLGSSSEIHELRRERRLATRTAAALVDNHVPAIRAALTGREPVLRHYAARVVNRTGRRPMAARLIVARDLRRMVFVVLGHRYALALLPVVLSVLDGDRTARLPSHGAGVTSGARGRRFANDDARRVVAL